MTVDRRFFRAIAHWCRADVSIVAVLILAGGELLMGPGAVASARGQTETGQSQAGAAEAKPPPGPAAHKGTFTDAEIVSMLSLPRHDQLRESYRKLEVPEALPGLIRIFRDPQRSEFVRDCAATLLGRIGSPPAKRALVEVLAKMQKPTTTFDPTYESYDAITRALYHCTKRQSEAQLIADLRHAHPEVRSMAARELGQRESVKAVPALIRLLDDPDPDSRLLATSALGEIRDPEGINELIAIVEKRRGGGHRLAAVGKIMQIGTPRCIQALNTVQPREHEYWRIARTPPQLVKAFQARLPRFKLVLEWVPGKGEKEPRYPPLLLAVSTYNVPREWHAARISEDQAARIIDHLLADGFFERARSRQNYGPLPPSRYRLEVSSSDGPLLCETPPWDPQFMGRLQALRKVLDDQTDAAKAMDAMLGQLQPKGKASENGK